MITRRSVLAMLTASTAVSPGWVHASAGAEESLLDTAKALAARPYVPPSRDLPPPFAGLDYNAYRGIRPKAGQAAMLPQGDGFAVDFLPPGLYFPDPVAIERTLAGTTQDLAFSPSLFTFEPRYFDDIPATSPAGGFSGFRLRHPLNTPDVMDEVAVFQGASYFRAIGRAMSYGLSARAVALGTGGPTPEEFPRFTRFRLHEGQGDRIRVEAVIDSPSLAGYADMTLIPGTGTVMDIAITLFPRVEISDIGIAPLTSMYLKGPMHAAVSDDFRPRVHDSDVLVIENGAGEQLWRPIGNPARVETSAFADHNPARFGLFQTARAYEDFEDTEAQYQNRPSASVAPMGDWGAGAVILVEIPTGTEFLDNIVAFWRPEAPLQAGGQYSYRYRLTWTKSDPQLSVPAKILQSRSGREHDRPGSRRFVVDVSTLPNGVTPDLSVSGTPAEAVFGLSHFALPDGRGSRVTFLFAPEEAEAAELRLVLRDTDGQPASPVWLHRWTRKRDGGV
ncbi:glucan biosynthesis protein [Marivita sp. S6314]|uniref:glucan biosynthesis protein n=1 Tax=Marivita sp. S6314 TaxID=2926406 RepID=UPI001FF51ECA|nr:glucan biosynthesis protein [Marivita sp. S6314]